MDKRILVIDDECLIAMAVEKALSKVGYNIMSAVDRVSFHTLAGTDIFDLVIMDLNMKDLTVDEIRETVLKTSPGARFLIMSGSNYDGSGFFLQKPFRIDELRRLVGEIIGSD